MDETGKTVWTCRVSKSTVDEAIADAMFYGNQRFSKIYEPCRPISVQVQQLKGAKNAEIMLIVQTEPGEFNETFADWYGKQKPAISKVVDFHVS